MAGFKQTKRVSWPTNGNLCKVRLFLSEDAPSQSGLGAQDHLQARPSWLLHAAGFADSDDFLPPGFEAPHKYHHPNIEISQITLIKWQCPPRLVLNAEWLVVAGEESEEVASENQRQPGVLEAVYPRPSSIPPNPFVAPDVQAALVDDSCTLHIPITAIEVDDGTEQLDTLMPSINAPVQLQHLSNAEQLQHLSNAEQLRPESNKMPSMRNVPCSEQPTASAALLAESDVLAAAFMAITRSFEEGSLIDHELLTKILNNPVTVQRLLSEYGAPKQTPPQPPPPSVIDTAATTTSWPSPPPPQIAFSAPLSAPPTSNIIHVPTPALNHCPPPHMPVAAPMRAPPARDVNYYKSLIQMHGGEKQESPSDQNQMQFSNLGLDPIGVGGMNQRDLKGKVVKPCTYFNTSRGCRHGASCLYLHDSSSILQRIEQQKGPTKRIKLDAWRDL